MAIEPHLPALRRYARAAMGSSRLGDAVLAGCLPRLAREARDRDGLLRGLIAALDGGSLARMAAPGDLPGAIARLPPLPRHALLLTLLEQLPADHAALLLGVTPGEVAEALAQARGALAPLRPARILIIGDGRGTLAQLVQGLGHAVCAQVANEDAAWQAAARTRPDLVLAEAALPDGGCGLAAVQRIAANDAVPVVLVGEDALAAHGFPLLRRPWRAEALRHAIGRALRGRHGRAG